MAKPHPRRDYDTSGVDPDIAPHLMAMVSPRRFWHCRQVAILAASLAARWGLDVDDARRAGLLHDICRENKDQWLSMATAEGIALPAWAGDDAGHLHGPLAAIVARREFNLPLAWCRAIAGHTTALPDLSREVMILFIADHACKGRRQPEVPHWRELAHRDLDAAAEEMLTYLLQSLLRQGNILWPPTVQARNELVMTRRTKDEGRQ